MAGDKQNVNSGQKEKKLLTSPSRETIYPSTLIRKNSQNIFAEGMVALEQYLELKKKDISSLSFLMNLKKQYQYNKKLCEHKNLAISKFTHANNLGNQPAGELLTLITSGNIKELMQQVDKFRKANFQQLLNRNSSSSRLTFK